MDKSLGQSIAKAVVNLEKSEATVRLALGCLSRAKRLVDRLVEPMPFDRLSKLGDKPTLNIRLRSAHQAVETLLRHGVRPPKLLVIVIVAVDRVLVIISLGVLAVGGGVGREGVVKLML